MNRPSDSWALVAIVFGLLIWNGAILAGTAYIVFWQGHSGWWWLLAVALMTGSASATDKVK